MEHAKVLYNSKTFRIVMYCKNIAFILGLKLDSENNCFIQKLKRTNKNSNEMKCAKVLYNSKFKESYVL